MGFLAVCGILVMIADNMLDLSTMDKLFCIWAFFMAFFGDMVLISIARNV